MVVKSFRLRRRLRELDQLGVRTTETGQQVAQFHDELLRHCHAVLPDLVEELESRLDVLPYDRDSFQRAAGDCQVLRRLRAGSFRIWIYRAYVRSSASTLTAVLRQRLWIQSSG